MNELWGQPVIVESRQGAAGWRGIVAMSRMPADGYTIGALALTGIDPPLLTGIDPAVISSMDVDAA